MIDLRSDTVTRPGEGMRDAMARAGVGDDVFGEDPTINQLQQEVAAMLGKEAGLYVPSGTMANQIAVKVHTQPADEVLLDAGAHIFNYEAAAAPFLSQVQMHPLPGKNGILTAEQVEAAIRAPLGVHAPRTRLVCLENTHNRAGGVIYPIHDIQRIHDVVKDKGLKLHLDGARLWNASVATGIPLNEYAQYFDTVSVCFSKGLGAPVGSMITGDKAAIESALRYRKIFGGGMRQAGVIAAGALYAVHNNLQRLKDDHTHCRELAVSLAQIPGISVDLETVQTNILFFEVSHPNWTAVSLVEALGKESVQMMALSPKRIRAVTHLDVSKEEIHHTIELFQELLN